MKKLDINSFMNPKSEQVPVGDAEQTPPAETNSEIDLTGIVPPKEPEGGWLKAIREADTLEDAMNMFPRVGEDRVLVPESLIRSSAEAAIIEFLMLSLMTNMTDADAETFLGPMEKFSLAINKDSDEEPMPFLHESLLALRELKSKYSN